MAISPQPSAISPDRIAHSVRPKPKVTGMENVQLLLTQSDRVKETSRTTHCDALPLIH